MRREEIHEDGPAPDRAMDAGEGRSVKRKAAIWVCAAAAMLGAHASGASKGVLGAWAGTTEWGYRAETVIEAVADDGQVTGAMCTMWESGHIGGTAFKAPENPPAYDGLEVTALAGENLVVHAPQGAGKLMRWETYAAKRGRERTDEAVLERTAKLLCAHLFAAGARPLPEIEGETGEDLIGYWRGYFGNGQGAELLVERLTQDGQAEGRWCWTRKDNGITFIRDFYPGGPAQTTYDRARGRLTVELQMTRHQKDREQFTLLTGETVSATSTAWVDKPKENEVHALMTRGAAADGCLAMTYLNDPEGTRDPQTRHPRLWQVGEPVPPMRRSQTFKNDGQ